jgi:hypothetical protein
MTTLPPEHTPGQDDAGNVTSIEQALYQSQRDKTIDRLAALGLQLFPCKPNKTPWTGNGFKAATDERGKLREMFAKHPDAMIGIRTGEASAFFVLDIDNKHGKDGRTWLQMKLQQHGPFPSCPVAFTPNGGEHYYFAYPRDRVIKCSAGDIAPGVDVRGDGGYVCAPPSVSVEGAYKWKASTGECLSALRQAPDWLLDAVCEPEDGELPPLDPTAPRTDDDRKLAQRLLDEQLLKVRTAAEGTRNATLNGAAFMCGKLVAAGVFGEDSTREQLEAAGRAAGLEQREIIGTVRSGMCSGLREPWRPYAVSEKLNELNREHFLAQAGKTALVYRQETDPVSGYRVLSPMYTKTFKELLSNRSVGSKRKVPLGLAWMSWASRRQYNSVVFAPDKQLPANYYNLWQGFAVEPEPGDCHLFLEFVHDVVCSGDAGFHDYLIGWCARAVQFPGEQGEVAIVLKSDEGTGKGFFIRHFGELFGAHYCYVSNSRHLVGNFNAHLETAVVVFADEAFWAGDKQGEGVLKALITEPTMRIEPKGIDARSAPNFTYVMMASNNDWVVPAGHTSRRFAVNEVSDVHRQDHNYFAALQAEWDAGGREAFMHHLLNLDLRDFNVRRVPQTGALLGQKLLSLPPVDRWYYDMLQRGMNEGGVWKDWVGTDFLWLNYCEQENRPGPRNAFGMRLLGNGTQPGLLPPGARRRKGNGGFAGRCWGYEFPPLEDCRKHFEQRLGAKLDWGDEET